MLEVALANAYPVEHMLPAFDDFRRRCSAEHRVRLERCRALAPRLIEVLPVASHPDIWREALHLVVRAYLALLEGEYSLALTLHEEAMEALHQHALER